MILAVLASLVVVGYSSSDPPSGWAASGSGEAGPPLPEGCQLYQVRNLFEGFFEAVNTRDELDALRYIAPRPELNGFGIGMGPTKRWMLRSRDPETVYRHFAARAREGQRLSLLGASVSVVNPGALHSGPFRRPESGPTAGDPVVGLSFQFGLRQPGQPVLQPGGKGGIDCPTGQFYVWVMQIAPPPEPVPGVVGARPCGNKPRVDATHPPKTPVMCQH